MAAVATDVKAGWSTYCRRGEFETCETVGAECVNPRHGRRSSFRCYRCRRGDCETCLGGRCGCDHNLDRIGTSPEAQAQRAERVTEWAKGERRRARREGDDTARPVEPTPAKSPPVPVSAPSPRVENPEPVGTLSERILAVLAEGPVVSENGHAASLLAERLDASPNSISQALKRLAASGQIERYTTDKRTWRVWLPGREEPAGSRGQVPEAGSRPDEHGARGREDHQPLPPSPEPPPLGDTPTAIVAWLGEHGPIVSASGRATAVLANGLGRHPFTIRKALQELEHAGRIERHINGTKTHRIALVGQGAASGGTAEAASSVGLPTAEPAGTVSAAPPEAVNPLDLVSVTVRLPIEVHRVIEARAAGEERTVKQQIRHVLKLYAAWSRP